jgi:poly-gamma-glutamate synthesis protein (capsule biosynthesis protein)
VKPGPRWIPVTAGVALVLSSLALLAAVLWWGGGGDASADEPVASTGAVETTVPPPTTAPPTTPAARDPVLGSGQPVVLAFGGDVHFEGSIRAKLAADPASVFAGVAPVFAEADLSMVNLETAITERGTPGPKEYTFRAPVSAFEAPRAGHADVVTMATTPGVDYGPEGLADTLAARDATGFPVVGLGRDAAEAYAPWRTEIKGQRVAVFGASEVIDNFARESWRATDTQAGMASAYPEAVDLLLEQVRAARADSDTIVVYLHFGRELEPCPNDRQKALVQRLTEAGADLVVGSHAHRLQGGGRHGEAFADYGLGNFVFYNDTGAAAQTGVLLVTATGRRVDGYEWRPARVRGGVPVLLQGPEADQAVAEWDALRGCTDLTP